MWVTGKGQIIVFKPFLCLKIKGGRAGIFH